MMEKKQFTVHIDASAQKVWDSLWSDSSYRQWTEPFQAGSHAVSDWKKGSKVLFLDSKGSGMVSEIFDMVPNERMNIRHLGSVKDGREVLDDPEDKKWAGATENYYLSPEGSGTLLRVEFDTQGMPEDMLAYFLKIWPVALDKLKSIAEAKNN